MQTHLPAILKGPFTQDRPWWPRARMPRGRRNGDDRALRIELVQRVRREIAAGDYETPEKWEAALDRLLSRIESE
jgi:hypothetical protein